MSTALKQPFKTFTNYVFDLFKSNQKRFDDLIAADDRINRINERVNAYGIYAGETIGQKIDDARMNVLKSDFDQESIDALESVMMEKFAVQGVNPMVSNLFETHRITLQSESIHLLRSACKAAIEIFQGRIDQLRASEEQHYKDLGLDPSLIKDNDAVKHLEGCRGRVREFIRKLDNGESVEQVWPSALAEIRALLTQGI